jgi:hypothetical protein
LTVAVKAAAVEFNQVGRRFHGFSTSRHWPSGIGLEGPGSHPTH